MPTRHKSIKLFSAKEGLRSCVVFLVHGTILQQWTSLLKNSDSIEKRKNPVRDCWTIVPVTAYSYQWLLNNFASDCWTFVPVTIEELCQWLLKNRASVYWTILPATLAHNSELFNNGASDCWRIIPATVEELCQWLLKNCASDCWWSVPTAVEQSCQVFFSLFLTYFGKVSTGFSCKYFNYYWLFQFRIKTID